MVAGPRSKPAVIERSARTAKIGAAKDASAARDSRAFPSALDSADDAADLSRLEARLPLLLSMIAGMVDSTGFFTLGHVFTAHVTGNIVLAAGVAVDGGSFHWAQL